MKRHISAMLLLSMALFAAPTFVSCSDDDDDFHEEFIAYNKLPAQAQAFIVHYYDGIGVSKVEKERDHGETLYEVTMANRHEITFASSGEWVEVDAPDGMEIPFAIAPMEIRNYLTSNYRGYGINGLTRTGYGYEVELTTGVDLQFDAYGNFLGIDD